MPLLSSIKNLLADFFFPRSPRVLELEAFSSGDLLELLPSAENNENKNVIALFDYSHPLTKEIIWELKYSGNRQMADKLGGILSDVLHQELGERAFFEKWDRPILVPIPISDKRRFERGWNQSELLAEKIVAYDRAKLFKYLPGQLVKPLHTESQTKTGSRSERLKNVANSMKVLNGDKVAGRCVVLVDDVTTTGATFAEARRALGAAGAKKILCIAVAH